ncbi:unnamed protein product [Trichobilharzia regenti]|nr:unnamed protein product [Trichobilharzia regenti]
MELKSVRSERFRIGDLKEKFSYRLPDVHNILKQKNLHYDGEYTTLEEILKIIPARNTNDMQFNTLADLKKETEGLNSKTSVLTATRRIPRPFVDMSYRNSMEESLAATEVNQDIFVTVLIYRPLCLPALDPCSQVLSFIIPITGLKVSTISHYPEWAKGKKELECYGPFASSSMQSVKLEDLSIYVGKPYFFVHQGNCEHMMIFSDVR